MSGAFDPIIIEPCTDYGGALRVRRGDRYVHGLGRDEALWVVSGLLHNASTPYNQGLLTSEEHAARAAAAKARHEARAAEDVVDATFDPVSDLKDTLRALLTNPHLNLGDLVYQVREREGLGWEGPAVTAWSAAVNKAQELVK